MREWTRRAIRKAERRATYQQRIAERKARYAQEKADGTFHLQWEFIQCYWREGFSLSECAEVLGITEEQASFERDIAIQNSQ